MPIYSIEMDGTREDPVSAEYESLEQARNAAIVLLGGYLQEHPVFAYERHWRVDVKDQAGRLLLHVIVATVDAPGFINWQSFE